MNATTIVRINDTFENEPALIGTEAQYESTHTDNAGKAYHYFNLLGTSDYIRNHTDGAVCLYDGEFDIL